MAIRVFALAVEAAKTYELKTEFIPGIVEGTWLDRKWKIKPKVRIWVEDAETGTVVPTPTR